MTPEERQQKYLQAQEELSKLYGFQLKAVVVARMLGEVLQAEPQLSLVPVEGWDGTN